MNSRLLHTEYLNLLKSTLDKLSAENLEKVTEAFLETYQNGGTFYVFGNGGSAATASHMAGDFVKGASSGLENRFRFICLNDNMSALMAIANDISYDDVFMEQLKNFVRKEDLVIGISGSGNSTNVVKALAYANEIGAKTLALCGYSGGKIKEISMYCIHAEVHDMEVAEDVHMVIFHTIKQALIKHLHGEKSVSMGKVYDERIKGKTE
ncbi:MAG: SIS domain-containing protein [Flavobacteriales bacterium]|nr:SIS domain-containing protein [Flavobacteriales bacterium]